MRTARAKSLDTAPVPAATVARAHDDVGGPVGELYDRLQFRVVPIMRAEPPRREPALERLSRVAGYATLGACYVAVMAWFLA